MSVRHSLLIAALAACASPALADDPAKSMVAPLQAATSAEGDKVVCKKTTETGSLVKRTKVCLTRDQWNRSGENHRRYGEQLQDDLRSKPPGGQ